MSGISKVYRIGAPRAPYLTLRDSVAGAAMQVVRQVARMATGAAAYRTRSEALWALTDVTFEVNQGACFGIIGRNGAGKTTVLKILSRITPPTAGQIICHGRVASLLGVGTGFHPELTGRENIFLNGTLLGMTRAEVRRKFDEIVAFAEIEQLLETPGKRYARGMYVRLAFAVAQCGILRDGRHPRGRRHLPRAEQCAGGRAAGSGRSMQAFISPRALMTTAAHVRRATLAAS